MTDRLYYDDSHLTEFKATILEEYTLEGEQILVLDRTAFYPEGGGQPSDQGVINGVRVRSVETRESDHARHSYYGGNSRW